MSTSQRKDINFGCIQIHTSKGKYLQLLREAERGDTSPLTFDLDIEGNTNCNHDLWMTFTFTHGTLIFCPKTMFYSKFTMKTTHFDLWVC